MGVSPTDGWQRKAGHKVIRNQGKAARDAAQAKAKLDSAKSVSKPIQTQQTGPSKKPVGPGKDIAQTHQRIRPETQTQASRQLHADKAAKQHMKVRNDARNLEALSTKATTPTKTDNTATRTAVNQKSDAQQANFAKQGGAKPEQPAVKGQPTQPEFPNVKKPAEQSQPKTKVAQKNVAKDGKKGTEGAKTKAGAETGKDAARPEVASQNAAIAGAQAGQGTLETARTGRDDIDSSEDESLDDDQDPNTSAFASGSKVKSTKRELGGLLGGFAGGEGDESPGENAGGAVAAVEKKDAAEKIPEKDPASKVYSEFDEANPGVEDVWQRAKAFNRFVEKRVTEIAKLDHDLDGKIKNMFETTPLSERVVGDLRKELRAADILRSSVYGGIIG